jgi:hypothetical protein
MIRISRSMHSGRSGRVAWVVAPLLAIVLHSCSSITTQQASDPTTAPSASLAAVPPSDAVVATADDEATSSVVTSTTAVTTTTADTTTTAATTTTAVTTTTAAPETSTQVEAFGTTRPLPDPPPAPNATCAQLLLDIDASQLDAELAGRAVDFARPTDGNGCEVPFYRPYPDPDLSVVSIGRWSTNRKARTCCDRTLDDDEIAQELDDGSTMYLDPTARDVDRVPEAGRVTIIRPDKSAVVISSYGGALTMEQLETIARKLHALDFPAP